MDNDTTILEKFLGRSVLFERTSTQMWGPTLGDIRCPGEIISQKFLLEFWDERRVCSVLTMVKMALAAWTWQSRENDPHSGLANTISFWIHGSPRQEYTKQCSISKAREIKKKHAEMTLRIGFLGFLWTDRGCWLEIAAAVLLPVLIISRLPLLWITVVLKSQQIK